MGKVGNNTNIRDKSDMSKKEPQAVSQGHKSGRRVSGGSGVVGTPKHAQLAAARDSNKAHVKKFRSGSQDARMGGDLVGPLSPSSLQVKTRRRGNGPMTRMPNPSGGE
jgi:hypothetical protein